MPLYIIYIYMEQYNKLFFAATISLIVVSLFACIIKWFYRPRAYKEHFSQLFPGHGGVLDRFDSILAVSIAMMCLTTFVDFF